MTVLIRRTEAAAPGRRPTSQQPPTAVAPAGIGRRDPAGPCSAVSPDAMMER